MKMDVGSISDDIPVWLITGVLILLMDAKGSKKENKIARALGWTNVSVGVLLFVGRWIVDMVI